MDTNNPGPASQTQDVRQHTPATVNAESALRANPAPGETGKPEVRLYLAQTGSRYAVRTNARVMFYSDTLGWQYNPAMPEAYETFERYEAEWQKERRLTPTQQHHFLVTHPLPAEFWHDATPPAPKQATPDAANVTPRIYVASKTRHAKLWKQWRDELGMPIVSTWIDEAGVGETSNWNDLWNRCVTEAKNATALLVLRDPGDTLKGALVEIGAALGAGVPVYCVGDMSEQGTWHRHNLCQPCGTMSEAFEKIMRPATHPASPQEASSTAKGGAVDSATPIMDEIRAVVNGPVATDFGKLYYIRRIINKAAPASSPSTPAVELCEALLSKLLKDGDPFNGDDWELVQKLREYLRTRSAPAARGTLTPAAQHDSIEKSSEQS